MFLESERTKEKLHGLHEFVFLANVQVKLDAKLFSKEFDLL